MEKVFIYLQACLTLIISVVGAYFSYVQYDLNVIKRKDDLFDRRYKFYAKLSCLWISTSDDDGDEYNGIPLEVLAPIAIESQFLFGSDISDHIMSLQGKTHTGCDSFPDSDFIEPFLKYLNLEIITNLSTRLNFERNDL